jgi:hypothetical protein
MSTNAGANVVTTSSSRVASKNASGNGKRPADQLTDAVDVDTLHEVSGDIAKTVKYLKDAWDAASRQLSEHEELVTPAYLEEMSFFSNLLRRAAIRHVVHLHSITQIGKLKTRVDDIDGGYPGAPTGKIKKAYAMAVNYSIRFKDELDNERVEWKQKKEAEGLAKASKAQEKRNERNQELDGAKASQPVQPLKKPRIAIPNPLEAADL